jgi:ATP-binding cassette subfamily F protein uup
LTKLILDKFNLQGQTPATAWEFLGRNGSGKTSFLKTAGQVNCNLTPARSKWHARPDIRLFRPETLGCSMTITYPAGNALRTEAATISMCAANTRHVCGYLKDFPVRARRCVAQGFKTLSGGQKNRLMLAKVLANPRQLPYPRRAHQ